MSETASSATREPTEDDYQTARAFAIEATVEFLRIGDRLGKEGTMMAAEFMVAFQAAAEEVLGQ